MVVFIFFSFSWKNFFYTVVFCRLNVILERGLKKFLTWHQRAEGLLSGASGTLSHYLFSEQILHSRESIFHMRTYGGKRRVRYGWVKLPGTLHAWVRSSEIKVSHKLAAMFLDFVEPLSGSTWWESPISDQEGSDMCSQEFEVGLCFPWPLGENGNLESSECWRT